VENLRKVMQKNAVSVLDDIVIRWKGQGDILSGNYTAYYFRGKGLKEV